MSLKQDRLTINKNKQINFYRAPYTPRTDHPIEMAVYRSYLRYFEVKFNAKANGIKFKSLDKHLTHWLTNQGDDIIMKVNEATGTLSGQEAKRKSIKILSHNKSHADHWRGTDFGIEKFDSSSLPRTNNKDANDVLRIEGKRKLLPIVYTGFKINRARLVAAYFVSNDEKLPFVAVIDGDTNNLYASNLYWTTTNMFPELNHTYEAEDIAHDVVIHAPSIRVMRENFNLYGWDKSFTKVTVPIPNDLLLFFKQWRINIQSAVFTSLKYISQWSFTVYSIEYKEDNKVFIGYSPAMDGIYVDQIYKVAKEVPWLNEVMFTEGYGVLKTRYLTMSQTRVEAHESCTRFMNDYHNKGWQIMNTDFYSIHMERQLTVSLTNAELESINTKLLSERGVDLQTYLNATVRKFKKESIPPKKGDA